MDYGFAPQVYEGRRCCQVSGLYVLAEYRGQVMRYFYLSVVAVPAIQGQERQGRGRGYRCCYGD